MHVIFFLSVNCIFFFLAIKESRNPLWFLSGICCVVSVEYGGIGPKAEGVFGVFFFNSNLFFTMTGFWKVLIYSPTDYQQTDGNGIPWGDCTVYKGNMKEILSAYSWRHSLQWVLLMLVYSLQIVLLKTVSRFEAVHCGSYEEGSCRLQTHSTTEFQLGRPERVQFVFGSVCECLVLY